MNKIIVEILFPEVCNLFGDIGNINYLKKCLPDATFISTPLNGVPFFAQNSVNLIYIGAMTEKTQSDVVKRLSPYKQRLAQLIADGTPFLATGNALEVFGKNISDSSGETINCLGLIGISAKRDLLHRFSGLLLGEFNDSEIVGFRAQFSVAYSVDSDTTPFITVKKGKPMNHDVNYEGVRINNFFGTYLLGPFLVVNPFFTKFFLKLVCGSDVPLAFESEVIHAYNERIADFKRHQVKIK